MGSIKTNRVDLCSTSTSAILGLALMYFKSFLSHNHHCLAHLQIFCIFHQKLAEDFGMLFHHPVE